MSWTLNNVALSTLASSARLDTYSLAPDTLTLEVARDLLQSPLYAHLAPITLRYGNDKRFVGYCDRTPAEATGQAEGQAVVARNAWWLLERLPFQQRHLVNEYNAETETWSQVWQYKSRAILGQAEDGTSLTIAQVVTEILAYAATCGVSIAAGTIEGATTFPFDEIVDLTCAEAILRVVRWDPGLVAWFDYSTATPTLNLRARSALAAVTAAINPASRATAAVSSVSLTPRTDLQLPAVVLLYERSSDAGSQQLETISTDAYPLGATGRTVGALVATIQLAGAQIVRQQQAIAVEAYPAEGNDAAWSTWWKARIEWLRNAGGDYASLTIHNTSRRAGEAPEGGWYGATPLPSELLEGTIQDWMTGVHAERETITAYVDYVKTDGTTETDREISIVVTSTDATSRTYWRLAVAQSAEPVPVGLAAALYAAANALHYDGTLSIEEDECSGAYRPGRVLNISGGQSAWAAMAAQIAQASEDLFSGRTTLQVGPPKYLSLPDLVTLLRTNRTRRPAQRSQVRLTGLSSDNGLSVALGSAHPRSDAVTGPGGTLGRLVVGGSGSTIDLNPPSGTMQPRQLTVLTAIQWSDENHQYEYKTWTGYVLATAGATSDWIGIVEHVPCPTS